MKASTSYLFRAIVALTDSSSPSSIFSHWYFQAPWEDFVSCFSAVKFAARDLFNFVFKWKKLYLPKSMGQHQFYSCLLPSRFVTQALDPYQPLEVLRSFFAVHFDFSGPTCLKSVQESVTSTPPDEGYCSGCSDNHGAHCNLHLSSFFQFSSESLLFLQFVVFLLPDVGIATLPDCI